MNNLVKRRDLNRPLTWAEMDSNWDAIEDAVNDKVEKTYVDSIVGDINEILTKIVGE